MRITRFLWVALATTSLLTSCSKYDDDQIKHDISSLNDRVTKLEGQVVSLEEALTTLKAVVDNNMAVAAFFSTEKGYRMVFSNSQTLELRHGKAGGEGSKGENYIKSISHDGDCITIVLNDKNQTTFKVPCMLEFAVGDVTKASLEVSAGSNEIPITISHMESVVSVTATLNSGSEVVSNTQTRAATLDWAVQVSTDFKTITVNIPSGSSTTSALLQVIVARADGDTMTATKHLQKQ